MMSPEQSNSIAKVFEIDSRIDLLVVKRFEVFLVGMQAFLQEITVQAPISQYSIAEIKNDNNYCQFNNKTFIGFAKYILTSCIL